MSVGSLLACEGHFKVLWVHFEGSMLAYEDHFRVLWVHFEVRPSETGSEMKLERDPKAKFIEAPMCKSVEEQLKICLLYNCPW